MSKVLQNNRTRTRLLQLMNTSGFHRNVGEGNKSLYAMSPDPFLRVRVWLSETIPQAGQLSLCGCSIPSWLPTDTPQAQNGSPHVQ